MVTHCIIMSSSYTEGTRIAIDYCLKNDYAKKTLIKKIKEITDKCGDDVSISTHYIQTESEDWKTVCEKDLFFKDVKLVKSIDEFIKLIQKDRDLKGIDVAKYIISKINCTHLKLEKLVYLCYAEYLCETGKKLFKDEIYAFKYGPIVDSVYQTYKGYEELPQDEEKDINSNKTLEMPAKSRLLFAKDGIEKTYSIERTLEKYKNSTVADLIKLTHKDKTPWTETFTGKIYEPILDETILEYHKYEK